MWVGKELADGLDFGGFIISMIIGGLILSLYTGLLGYVGAETGMSLDLLARKAFGAKGSYLPSAMISFTQIGWFGVGIAMFAIPVANELLGGSTAAEWVLVIIAGAHQLYCGSAGCNPGYGCHGDGSQTGQRYAD